MNFVLPGLVFEVKANLEAGELECLGESKWHEEKVGPPDLLYTALFHWS